MALEERSNCWAFLQVVYKKESNQYIWVTNVPVDTEVAGPLDTEEDCIAQATGLVFFKKPGPAPGRLEIHKLIIIGKSLVKVLYFLRSSMRL